MDFSKFNKAGLIDWGIDTSKLEFKKLSEFPVGTVFQVVGMFKIKDKLNEGSYQPILITSNCLLNAPNHKIEIVNAILEDKNAIDAIINGDCFIKSTMYHNKKYKKDCYDFEFLDEKAILAIKAQN